MLPAGDLWIVVLAAGDGSRVRALTRDRYGAPAPKQYSTVDGTSTLLDLTLQRAARIAAPERTAIVVAREHRRWWEPELARLSPRSVIVQPENRGTAAGILLPLLWISARDPEARLVVLPSDHGVASEDILIDAISTAVDCTPRSDSPIVLLGVRPQRPEPGYGWIVPHRSNAPPPYEVAHFREKPDPAVSSRLLDRGGLVNSFIMIAGSRSLIEQFRTVTPRLWSSFLPIRRSIGAGTLTCPELAHHYRSVPKLDFSKDLLERAARALRVFPAPPCGWCDLGTRERFAAYRATQDLNPTTTSPSLPSFDVWRLRPASGAGLCAGRGLFSASDPDPRAAARQFTTPLPTDPTERNEVTP